MADNGKQTILDITGMTCGMCANHVVSALNGIDGVQRTELRNWKEGQATVAHDDTVSEDVLVDAVKGAGYMALLREHDRQKQEEDSDYEFDLVIVGGGSAAFAAAIKTSESGGTAVIINEGLPIGGTCVNVGCVPSKAMIRTAEALHTSASHPFEGIETSGRVTDFSKVTGQTQALVTDLRTKKYLEVVQDNPQIEVIQGRGHLRDRHTVIVGSRIISGKNILIATGARTWIPPIPGLESTAYLTNDELYKLDTLPEHLIVLGGRYIALENAQLFARLGSKVTVLQRSERVLPTESTDLTDALEGYLTEEGVEILTSVVVDRVDQVGQEIAVQLRVDGQEKIVYGSHLFIATGRTGNTEDLGLADLGIETHGRQFVKVDGSLRTSIPNIFAAGDVIGEQMFVYTAAYEGSLAAENGMTGYHLNRDYSALPWVVFTDPQVAGVGMNEKEAAEAGIKFEVSKLPLEQVPRAIAARETRGFIKLIRNADTDQLIGARILAHEGSELLMEVALAIKYGITVEEITRQFHPYLTLSEGIKLAAITFGKDVKKLSCCAV